MSGSLRAAAVPTLAERLGHRRGQRVLILNCDDLGMSHAANQGVYAALRDGLGTSASLMVPCPWAPHAAQLWDGEDVGVHLTLNAEFPPYRWAPLTAAPTLVDHDGRFPTTSDAVWARADVDEVRRECRAQIDQALSWGVDVTHLDAHMGTVQIVPNLFDVYLELAVEYRLPLRLSGPETEPLLGFPFRSLAAARDVVFTDDFVFVPQVGSRSVLLDAIERLPPGVTEAYLHPAVDCAELRAAASDWESRVDDYRLLVEDPELRDTLDAHGVVLIGFRDLRDVMRSTS